MQLIRKRLSAEEGAPANTRYNPDCDCVETTADGGDTWTENPGADPRSNPAYQMPPNTAPDVRCAAAAGMVADVQRVVDAGIVGGTVVGIGNILLALLVLPIGWMFLLILAIAGALLTAGGTALAAAFPPEVYDALLCLFEQNLDESGQLDAAALDNVIDTATTQFPDPLVATTLGLVRQLHGVVGLNNAGVLYADPDADCVACGWQLDADLTTFDGGFEAYIGGAGVYATYEPGSGWRSNYFAPPFFDHVQALIVCLSFDTSFLTRIGWETHGYGATNPSNDLFADCILGDFRQAGSPWEGGEDWDTLSVYAQWYPDATATQYVYLTAFSLQGTGTPPDLPGWILSTP